MTPGTYLHKRRVMAGYNASSLAREIIFREALGGRGELTTTRRLQLRLASAEDDVMHLDDRMLASVQAVVPLDVDLYRKLVAIARGQAWGSIPDLCKNCGCSFFDPCVNPPAQSAAPLGKSTCAMVEHDLCSNCAAIHQPDHRPPPTDFGAIRVVNTREA